MLRGQVKPDIFTKQAHFTSNRQCFKRLGDDFLKNKKASLIMLNQFSRSAVDAPKIRESLGKKND